jgi:hypothetical protein
MKNFIDATEMPPGRAVKGLAVASSIEEPAGVPGQSKVTGSQETIRGSDEKRDRVQTSRDLRFFLF